MIQIAETSGLFSIRPRFSQGLPRAFSAGNSALRSSSYPALRRLSCQYAEGVLIIQGRVSSYYEKQMAQTLLAKISDVAAIDNQIEVRPTDCRKV
jgi:hypothetical protein